MVNSFVGPKHDHHRGYRPGVEVVLVWLGVLLSAARHRNLGSESLSIPKTHLASRTSSR